MLRSTGLNHRRCIAAVRDFPTRCVTGVVAERLTRTPGTLKAGTKVPGSTIFSDRVFTGATGR